MKKDEKKENGSVNRNNSARGDKTARKNESAEKLKNYNGLLMARLEEDDGTTRNFYLLKDIAEAEFVLRKMGFRAFKQVDFEFDASLPQQLRESMREHSLCYALTLDENPMLYFYQAGRASLVSKLKYLRLFADENVEVDIDGAMFSYFMTNDFEALRKKLVELECRLPRKNEWSQNFALHKNVIDKMSEIGALFSLTFHRGCFVLNYYRDGGVPSIVFLKKISARVDDTEASFTGMLNFFISDFISDGAHRPCDVYKSLRGCMSKQTFSKLRKGEISPTKRSVLLLAVGLHLSLDDAEALLQSAGYAFSSDEEDSIFRGFIARGCCDIFQISDELYKRTGISLFREPRE